MCALQKPCKHLSLALLMRKAAVQMCVFAGAPGGTSLASASIVCQGPGVPVPLTGSAALAAYSNTFQGIAFTQDSDPDGKTQSTL